MKELCLIRHPKTVNPGEPRCAGQTDVELEPGWEAALEKALPALRKEKPQVILSSDLPRAVQPARWLAKKLEVPFEQDARWREISFGQWEGKPWSEIEVEDGERCRKWMDHYVTTRPPGGETLEEFAARAGDWLDRVLERDEQRGLAVAHAGWMRAVWCRVAGGALHHAFQLDVPYLGIMRLRYDGMGLRVALPVAGED